MSDQPHAQILKSTTIIGGSSVVNVIFYIIQAKAAALLLGPAGVGLMGLFNAALGLATTLAGMGLTTSGVRQIAEAVGTGDSGRISRTVTAFRWMALFFGLAGALLFFLLRFPIAQITFGDDEYAPAVGLLAVALFLTVVSKAQSTLIRGMRRVTDLARVSVTGIAIGTFLGIPLMYFWGVQGVAPYLVLSAVTTIMVSWWYARKIPIAKVPIAWNDISSEARGLLSLGIIFMLTSLTTMASTYLVKVVVVRQLGLESSGLFQAASALANVYVGFILGAMGADFFPHLASVSHDHTRSDQVINAQIEVGLLLAIPGILAVLALGPYLLQLLYSSQFSPAFEILRWMALGTFLRVISWPMGYVTLTQGKGQAFFWTELASNLFYLGVVALCIPVWGITGIGVAFLAEYLFHVGLMTLVARRMIGFRWSGRNLRLIGIVFPLILAAFLASFIFPPLLSAAVGLALAVGVGIYSLRSLYYLVGPSTARAYWQRFKSRLGWIKV